MKYLISILILFVASSLYAQDVLPTKPTDSSSKNDSVANRFRHLPEGKIDTVISRTSHMSIVDGNFQRREVVYKTFVSNKGIIGRDSIIIEDSKSKSRLNSTNAKTEWDWAFGCKKIESKHYPIEETYYVDERHPGYKVYSQDGGLYIVKDNTIVWVSSVLQWDWDQKTNPTYLLYKKAYSENAYGIKKEKSTVQTFIKYKLGIISSNEYRKYRIPLDDVGIGMRFLEQIKDDYLYLSNYGLKIERKSPTSFEFTDEKGNHFSVSYSLQNAKLKSNFVLHK